MKKLLIAAAVVSTSAVAAQVSQAADLPARVYTKASPLVVQAYNWTGFYAGVNVGYGFGRNRTDINLTPAGGPFDETTRLMPDGVLGGAQIGYNWQGGNFGLGNIVLGVEADIQGANLRNSLCSFGCDPALLGGTGFIYTQKLDWFGTVRGRVGVATGSVLSYITGGFAFGNVETGISSPLIGGASFKQTRTGWTIGSGVEAALGGNWTGKIEYLYLDLGTQNGSDLFPGVPPGTSLSSDIRSHIFRAGLNYRIGGTGVYAPEPVANWAGWYIGGNGGSATARNPSELSVVQPAPLPSGVLERFNLSPDGYFGGAQVGYNWQAANWVYGIEADIQGSSQKDNKLCIFACVAAAVSVPVEQKMQWFGTVRGRLGYSVGATLFYATGGFAYGGVKTSFGVNQVAPPPASSIEASSSQTRTGYAVGAGIESPFEFFGLFGKNWTAKTEYLFVDLGKTSVSLPIPAPVPAGTAFVIDSRVQEHIFRTGLSYHFNSPVVAKY